MTKKDLRDGMIVEIRCGKRYLVMNGCRVARRVEGFISLENQRIDLTYPSDDYFTIDKVYANDNDVFDLRSMFENPGKLLWARTTTKEMTLEEIEKKLGYKVKLVDNASKDELRVGDKVRTTKSTDYSGCELFPVGTVCTIKKITENIHNLPYLLYDGEDDWWYSEDMFEPCNRDFKVGDVVRIRQWDDMEKEFGFGCDGDINCDGSFVVEMKNLCGRKCTIKDIYDNIVRLDFEDSTGDIYWQYTTSMIEHI